MHRTGRRDRRTAVVIAVMLLALPAAASHAGKGKKPECPAEQVFLSDVSIGFHKGVRPEDVLPEFRAELETALQKAGFALAADSAMLGGRDVSLAVSLRAWTNRAPFTGRITQGLAARIEVRDGPEKVWDDHIAPGQTSRLRNFNNGTPKGLAKRIAALVTASCRAGWQPPD